MVSLPSRHEMLSMLSSTDFDVVIVGGGATGAGAFLEASSRGLKTLLIEANDFASGTSSKSTKLVHGGVRYLENAFKKLDKNEFLLVRDALHERAIFLKNAPHLTNPLPILTPVYNWVDVGYYLVGLKTYDLISGKASLGKSRFLNKTEMLNIFPRINQKNLKGAVLFYDGQFDDARMNVSLVLTGIREGGIALNYARCDGLIKKNDQISGIELTDMLTNNRFLVKTKTVINAAGPRADKLRLLDDPKNGPLIALSQGSHVVLDPEFSPKDAGLIIPHTEDNRVVFIVPWHGKTLAGTTDIKVSGDGEAKPSLDEVLYILENVSGLLDRKLELSDVKASFSGLRPLVKPKRVKKTAAISRDHYIEESKSGLITIVGGKWTTYRKMGQDVIDFILSKKNLVALRDSCTKDLPLVGADGFSPELVNTLQQEFQLSLEVATHLAHSYGMCAQAILSLGRNELLAKDFPFIEGEVIHALRNEYACSAFDLVARRMRLAFLDKRAAKKALPRIVSLMEQELRWSNDEANKALDGAQQQLDAMQFDLKP